MSTRRYAILGTGAIGGFYGAHLHQAGLEVHFLLHSDYAHVRENGLRIDSADRTLIVHPIHAHATVDTMPPCDVVLVSLKTTNNHLLSDLLPKPLAKNGVPLMLQNGIGSEDQAAAIVGNRPILGGLAFIAASKIGPGRIKHVDYSEVMLGEYRADGSPSGITPLVEQVAADFIAAGIPTSCAEDLLLARWKKLVWNVPYNALSVILNATTDQLMNTPATRALVEDLMREVLAGAAACGKHIDESFIQKMLKHTDEMRPYKPSMKMDYDAKRPLEIDAIYARPLAAAQAAGAQCPRTETLMRALSFLGAR